MRRLRNSQKYYYSINIFIIYYLLFIIIIIIIIIEISEMVHRLNSYCPPQPTPTTSLRHSQYII